MSQPTEKDNESARIIVFEHEMARPPGLHTWSKADAIRCAAQASADERARNAGDLRELACVFDANDKPAEAAVLRTAADALEADS